MLAPSVRSVLERLSKPRLVELARDLEVALPANGTKDELTRAWAGRDEASLPELLRALGRDELKQVCRAHEVDDHGRSRAELVRRLLSAAALDAHAHSEPHVEERRYLPRQGDIVQARHRQYLVGEVVPPPQPGEHHLVRMVCIDDDAQGRPLDVLWERELGARVVQPDAEGMGRVEGLDAPRHFAAYFHALKWNQVTATDGRLFQAPLRAGIALKNYQLTPLMKALELPRANLFIADDVGLGKTIEAGLVLQELILRQRVDFVLIVCPAAVTLQWRQEMERRFGLRFEVYNRDFVTARRQERGFGVNPWSTHNRFIISYQTYRRPENHAPLLHLLGDRRRPRSLLILDEAHTAAPASASKYAVDSEVTKRVRDLAPRFENRLFLSATPHNGHSNSFSALLEILDPQRFIRGIPVTGKEALRPVMVRRLKGDLTALRLPDTGFPTRRVLEWELRHDKPTGRWQFVEHIDLGPAGPALDLGSAEPVELVLSELLAEYKQLMCPPRGAGRLVFTTLQKRLLSSLEAFYRTLEKHAARVLSGEAAAAITPGEPQLPLGGDTLREEAADDMLGQDAESEEDQSDDAAAAGSRRLGTPTGRAREILDRMRDLGGRQRHAPDAKVRALVDWIRRSQCPAVAIGGAIPGQSTAWGPRRLIIFTEYGHTKSYLRRVLSTAITGTDAADERIRVFDGGMSEAARDELQRDWNAEPTRSSVRILLCTDAAREGVNLQGACADLLHFDIPWNPARMEQRNGRIDRTLQTAPEVRCAYFVYPQRAEDDVLSALVTKVQVIARELGSLSSVVSDRLAAIMDRGIDANTRTALDEAERPSARELAAARELEDSREAQILEAEITEAGKILNSSTRFLDFDPRLLRDALDVSLGWAGAPPLAVTAPPPAEPTLSAFTIPPLPDSFTATLDSLRPPRERDEPPWEWRRRPLLPVVFEPPRRLNTDVAHLHLSHPFVQRLLSRFLAQGHSAHDLSRVTVLRNRRDAVPRVVAIGRLSLLGADAIRLHDELILVAAAVVDGQPPQPFADAEDRQAIARLEELFSEAPQMEPVDARLAARFSSDAPEHFAALWPHVRAEADARAHDAERKLRLRGERESAELRRLLEQQLADARAAITTQLTFGFAENETDQREQLERDRRYIRDRVAAIGKELQEEPQQIADSYTVARQLLLPVGLVYLWPTTR